MLTTTDLPKVLDRNGIELISRDVGKGGSATVHHGRANRGKNGGKFGVGDELAIKEYIDEVVSKPEQLDRIKAEVVVGQAVQHPNVVRIYELLEVPGSAPLLLMEWIDGIPLDRWRKERAITWVEIQSIALGIIDGVSALHEKKIFHRDIKPANILVRKSGNPVLMDMGVVQIGGDNEATLHTSVKDFLGSVRYAAPQYLVGEPYAPADDIYSLAATLYILATGQEIYCEIERKSLLPYHIMTSRAAVSGMAEDVPSPIAILIEGGLHRDRERRPTLMEMKELLQNPSDSSYVKRELSARSREQRGFQVVSIADGGASLFADLRGKSPVRGRYSVVREGDPVLLPSLNSEIRSEKWIADVEFKHSRTGLGHFIVKGKRWVKGKDPEWVRSIAGFDPGTPGHWVEMDSLVERVRIGDYIVEETA